MGDTFRDLAERYNSSGEILRQVVRHELTGRGLVEHLPGAPVRIADVGDGAGQQAIPLYAEATKSPSSTPPRRCSRKRAKDSPMKRQASGSGCGSSGA